MMRWIKALWNKYICAEQAEPEIDHRTANTTYDIKRTPIQSDWTKSAAYIEWQRREREHAEQARLYEEDLARSNTARSAPPRPRT